MGLKREQQDVSTGLSNHQKNYLYLLILTVGNYQPGMQKVIGVFIN
jgi:hypothetical protein